MEYALHYALQGWAVFPLKPGGKAPLTEHGFKEATKDPKVIEAWWAKWPDANVGVVTGQQSGIVVLDVDRKHGVDGVIAATELDLPETLVVRTPTGGFHLIFSVPAGVVVPRRIGVRPGLDILGEGGYFVAAGSAVNGVHYEIVRQRPIAACPEILVSIAQQAKMRDDGRVEAHVQEGEKVKPGSRNQYLTQVGGKLRRIGFSEVEMTGALLIINTLRLEPPLPEAEVRRTASSIARYHPDAIAEEAASLGGPLVVRSLADLLSAEFPPQPLAIEPVLPHPGLMLLYGPTGISKTFFALGIGLALASGQKFMRWQSPARRGVLFVDGEMGNRPLQQRIRRLCAGHEFSPENFHLLTREDQGGGIIPNLEDRDAQERLLAAVPDGVELVILDNLSTLTAMMDSNDYKSWEPMQRLLLQFRRRGISAIVIHHANKGGTEQAGTSRRSHVMDTVISLRRHEAVEGSANGVKDIEVHVVKGRNLPPGEAEPFMASLSPAYGGGDGLCWMTEALTERKRAQVERALELGIPLARIIEETGCASSFAYRIKDEMERVGRIRYRNSPRGRKRAESWVPE